MTTSIDRYFIADVLIPVFKKIKGRFPEHQYGLSSDEKFK